MKSCNSPEKLKHCVLIILKHFFPWHIFLAKTIHWIQPGRKTEFSSDFVFAKIFHPSLAKNVVFDFGDCWMRQTRGWPPMTHRLHEEVSQISSTELCCTIHCLHSAPPHWGHCCSTTSGLILIAKGMGICSKATCRLLAVGRGVETKTGGCQARPMPAEGCWPLK